MTKIILILLFLIQFTGLSQDYRLVRVHLSSEADLKSLYESGIDFSGSKSGNNVIDLITNDFEYNSIIKPAYKHEILVNDLENYYAKILADTKPLPELQSGDYFRTGSVGGYFLVEEIYSEFDRMMEKYPDYISKFPIGKSIEGREIYSYCIGNRACFSDNIFPQVLISALHHAREPGSVFTVLYYFWDLFKRFDLNDNISQYILNTRHIYIIPVVNPDGVIYNEQTKPNGGGLWRKNRRINTDSSIGVDINRNYGPDYAWNSPNNGSSTVGKIETYRGTAPFSEPETQRVRDFVKDKQIKIAVNFHTTGNSVFYPYSYLTSVCADSLWYRGFLSENYRNNRYLFGMDNDVINYPTRGSADDFLYIGSNDFKGILSMTCEIGNGSLGFWQPIDIMLENAGKNISFMDNVILSADKNIALAEKDILKIDGKYFLKIKLQNIGYEPIEEFSFKLLSKTAGIIVEDKLYDGGSLSRSQSNDYLIEYSPAGITNGQMADFELEINLDFVKRIDFDLPVFEYQEYELFDSKNIQNWNLENDWNFTSGTNTGIILQSNNPFLYRPDLNSLAKFVLPDFQDSVSRYLLKFDHWIEIESNYDYGLIWTKYLNNNYKNPRLGEYLVTPSNRQGGTQKDSLQGFHGAFKYWMPQTIYLNEPGEHITEIAFNLRTDGGNNRAGWRIRNLRLRVFPKTPLSVNNYQYDSKLQIFPNPVSSGMMFLESGLSLFNAKIEIYNISGGLCFEYVSNIEQGTNIINTGFLAAGKYSVIIRSENVSRIIPLLIGK